MRYAAVYFTAALLFASARVASAQPTIIEIPADWQVNLGQGGKNDQIDARVLRPTPHESSDPPAAYSVTPVLFVPDPASFPAGYQPTTEELNEDLDNITIAMERIREWYGDALGQPTSLMVDPVVYMPAYGGLGAYEIIWWRPERRYGDGIVLGNTWGLVIGEVSSRGYGPGSASAPRITVVFCKGAGGFAGGAQWYREHGGGMCMLGDWCLDSLAGRVPPEWWDWWTGLDKQTGATGHEMGHTIGLPHPDAPNPVTGQQDYPYTIMGAWWSWPSFPINPADPTWPLRGLHGWADNDYLWVVSDYQDIFLLGYRPEWFSHLPSDVDRDGDVDLSDLATLLAAYGACTDDPGYSFYADLDKDGCVGLSDLATLLADYGYGT